MTKSSRYPLVSCIMPTADRKQFVEQAIIYFMAQDYPNKELIIVGDDKDDIPDNAFRLEYIDTYVLKPKQSIGAKRNLACEKAKGEIIIHWDDDDWYASARISNQVDRIIKGYTDICALSKPVFYSIKDQSFWEISARLNQKMFVKGVMGGSLAYRRSIWKEKARFPSTSLREDVDFMLMAESKGARLDIINAEDLYVYIRHDNTWKFQCGNFIDAKGWLCIKPPKQIEPHLKFYKQFANKSTFRLSEVGNSYSERLQKDRLVSCIMPTADRHHLIGKSIIQFLKQDYVNKELIIVDDGTIPCEISKYSKHSQIKYFRLDQKNTIGTKRNIACSKAAGEIIVHWDDDDWYSPEWIRLQVKTLLENDADICGLNMVYFIDPIYKESWRYEFPPMAYKWVHGATLAYRKSVWRENPFQNINIGEDIKFLWSCNSKKVIAHDFFESYVGLVHNKNTSKKRVNGHCWHKESYPIIAGIVNQYFTENTFAKRIN